MSMMIVANNKEIKPWIDNFKKIDKELDIQIYPDIKKKEAISFALVWSKNHIDFSQFKNLRCIASMGAGVEHILANETIQNEVFITKIVDEKLVSSMWEYLLCVVMNVVTNHYTYLRQQKDALWKTLSPKPMEQYTIGVMGLGQLGSIVAKNFKDMGFCVKGYAKSKKHFDDIQTSTELNTFLENVDILINLLPLTKKTKGILNQELFWKLNKDAYLINVGRGDHLVQNDLIEVLEKGHLSGATLDVFHEEPLPRENPLWSHPLIAITPHSASLTNPVSVAKQIMENYKRVSDGFNPFNIIDKEKEY